MSQLALTGACIYSPFQLIEDGVIVINDSKIEAMGPASQVEIPSTYREVPLDGLIIAPGFIDLHFHSNGKTSVMDGQANSIKELARFQATHGVTSFLATTITAPFQQLLEVARSFAELNRSGYKGARCLGIHLEGPFLSPRYPGHHMVEYLRLPSFESIMELQHNSEKGIKVVTMAPELPGAMSVATELGKEGIIAAIGYSDASHEKTIQAVQAGFAGVTCFQELRPLHHQEPGVIGAVLTLPELVAEIIGDGIQMHPVILKLLWRTKGVDGLIMVSDFRGPTRYEHGSLQSHDEEKISGGTATIEKAIQNFIEITQCKMSDALRLVTYNPAKYLGISKRKGSLYPGKDADLVVLTSDFDVLMTMVEGEVISGLISL